MKKEMIKLVAGAFAALTLTISVATPVLAASTDTNVNTQDANGPVVTDEWLQLQRERKEAALNEIAAMEITDPVKRAKRDLAVENERNIPQYGVIKQYLMEKGANLAFILGIYYIPSPSVYDIIKIMEYDIKNGNYAYIVDGHYYESPADDPKFNGDASYYVH